MWARKNGIARWTDLWVSFSKNLWIFLAPPSCSLFLKVTSNLLYRHYLPCKIFRSDKNIRQHFQLYKYLIRFTLACQICEWYQLYSVKQYSCAWYPAFTYLLPVFPGQSKFIIHLCNKIKYHMPFIVVNYILAVSMVNYTLFVCSNPACSLSWSSVLSQHIQVQTYIRNWCPAGTC